MMKLLPSISKNENDNQPVVQGHNQPTLIQPKLAIGQPDDEYEKEADAVAEKVVQMSPVSGTNEEEEKLSMYPNAMQPALQMKPAIQKLGGSYFAKASVGHDKTHASNDLSGKLQTTRGKGKTLTKGTQKEFGSKIGTDFGEVKVHTDHRAAQMNQELAAKAFTSGKDIYFNQGEYNPQSREGKKLLAHELVHTLQQKGPATIQRQMPDETPQTNVIDPLTAFIQELEEEIRIDENTFARPLSDENPHKDKDLDYPVTLEPRKKLLEFSNAIKNADEEIIPVLVREFIEFGIHQIIGWETIFEPVTEAGAVLTIENTNMLALELITLGMYDQASILRQFMFQEGAFNQDEIKHKENFNEGLVQVAINQLIVSEDPEIALKNIDLLLNTLQLLLDQITAPDDNQISRWAGYLETPVAEIMVSDLVKDLFISIEMEQQVLLDSILQNMKSPEQPHDKSNFPLIMDGFENTSIELKRIFESADNHLDFKLGAMRIDISKSDFNKKIDKHKDYFSESGDPSIPFEYFQLHQFNPMEINASLLDIIQARERQFELLAKLNDLNTGLPSFSIASFDLHGVENWRLFATEYYNRLKEEKGEEEALLEVIEILEHYLQAFTVSTIYNIHDVSSETDLDYLGTSFPRSLNGQIVHDCGIYALRIAYILKGLPEELGLDFYFILLPVHIGLLVTKHNEPLLIAHNSDFYRIDLDKVNAYYEAWKHTNSEGVKQEKEHSEGETQFRGEFAGAVFYKSVSIPGLPNQESPDLLSAIDFPFQVVHLSADEDLTAFFNHVMEGKVFDVQDSSLRAIIHTKFLEYYNERIIFFRNKVEPFHESVCQIFWNNFSESFDLNKDSEINVADIQSLNPENKVELERVVMKYRQVLDQLYQEKIISGSEPVQKLEEKINSILNDHPEFIAKESREGWESVRLGHGLRAASLLAFIDPDPFLLTYYMQYRAKLDKDIEFLLSPNTEKPDLNINILPCVDPNSAEGNLNEEEEYHKQNGEIDSCSYDETKTQVKKLLRGNPKSGEAIKAYELLDCLNQEDLTKFYEENPKLREKMEANLPVRYLESLDFGFQKGLSPEDETEILRLLDNPATWSDDYLFTLLLSIVAQEELGERAFDIIARHVEGIKDEEEKQAKKEFVANYGFMETGYRAPENFNWGSEFDYAKLFSKYLFSKGLVQRSPGQGRLGLAVMLKLWGKKHEVEDLDLVKLQEFIGPGHIAGIRFADLDERSGKLNLSMDLRDGFANISADSLPIESVNVQDSSYVFRAGGGLISGLKMTFDWPGKKENENVEGTMDVHLDILNFHNVRMTFDRSLYGIGDLTLLDINLNGDQALGPASTLKNGAAVMTKIIGVITNIGLLITAAINQSIHRFADPGNKETKEQLSSELAVSLANLFHQQLNIKLSIDRILITDLLNPALGLIELIDLGPTEIKLQSMETRHQFLEKMYRDLAAKAEDEHTRDVFLKAAEDEAQQFQEYLEAKNELALLKYKDRDRDKPRIDELEKEIAGIELLNELKLEITSSGKISDRDLINNLVANKLLEAQPEIGEIEIGQITYGTLFGPMGLSETFLDLDNLHLPEILVPSFQYQSKDKSNVIKGTEGALHDIRASLQLKFSDDYDNPFRIEAVTLRNVFLGNLSAKSLDIKVKIKGKEIEVSIPESTGASLQGISLEGLELTYVPTTDEKKEHWTWAVAEGFDQFKGSVESISTIRAQAAVATILSTSAVLDVGKITFQGDKNGAIQITVADPTIGLPGDLGDKLGISGREEPDVPRSALGRKNVIGTSEFSIVINPEALLFKINSPDQAFLDELDSGKIPDLLGREFAAHNMALLDNVTVNTTTTENEWQIFNGDYEYNLKMADGNLEIQGAITQYVLSDPYLKNIYLTVKKDTVIQFDATIPGTVIIDEGIATFGDGKKAGAYIVKSPQNLEITRLEVQHQASSPKNDPGNMTQPLIDSPSNTEKKCDVPEPDEFLELRGYKAMINSLEFLKLLDPSTTNQIIDNIYLLAFQEYNKFVDDNSCSIIEQFEIPEDYLYVFDSLDTSNGKINLMLFDEIVEIPVVEGFIDIGKTIQNLLQALKNLIGGHNEEEFFGKKVVNGAKKLEYIMDSGSSLGFDGGRLVPDVMENIIRGIANGRGLEEISSLVETTFFRVKGGMVHLGVQIFDWGKGIDICNESCLVPSKGIQLSCLIRYQLSKPPAESEMNRESYEGPQMTKDELVDAMIEAMYDLNDTRVKNLSFILLYRLLSELTEFDIADLKFGFDLENIDLKRAESQINIILTDLAEKMGVGDLGSIKFGTDEDGLARSSIIIDKADMEKIESGMINLPPLTYFYQDQVRIDFEAVQIHPSLLTMNDPDGKIEFKSESGSFLSLNGFKAAIRK